MWGRNNMCLICVEIISKKMSVYEGRLALVELKSTMPADHAADVKQLLDTVEWQANNRREPIDLPEDYD